MVSVPDHPRRSSLPHDVESGRPRQRRFRLFAALVAPFRDMDDRALLNKREQVETRNNRDGNLLAPGAACAEIPLREFPRSDN